MKHICQECGRPAVYQRKQVGRKSADRRRARKDHDLCERHWKAYMARVHSLEMKEAA